METDIIAALAEPLPRDEIKLRVGQVTKNSKGERQRVPYEDGTKATLLAYHDARHVMERLDNVFGSHAWQDSYRVLGAGAVECTLSIFMEASNRWVSKSDVGYPNSPTDPEPEALKSAYSDAFKRAGVKWGIGRYLYALPESGWWPVNKWGKLSASDEEKVRKRMFDGLQIEPPADPPAPEATQAEKITALVKEFKTGDAVKAKMAEWDLTPSVNGFNSLAPDAFAELRTIAAGS